MFRIERKEQRILSGGLNLVAPADLTQEGGAVSMDNFRVDQVGNIKSRYGRNSISVLTGAINNIALRGAGRYVSNTAGALWLNGVALDSGYDANPLGLVSFLGYAWIMNQARQKRTPGGLTIETWLPTAPGNPVLTESGVGELVVGQTYTYWVTWVTSDGQETNPNATATTKTITAGNGIINVARPATADARVTHWNVYRSGNTLPDTYLVNADPIAYATATYADDGAATDQKADLDLTRLGIALETDHDPPPAAAGLAGPYYSKLLAWNTSAHPNWLYWSATNRPYMFPGSTLDEGNHTPVGDDNETLYAVIPYARHVRLYGRRGIYRISGDPDDFSGDMQQISIDVQLVGPKAICSAGGIDYLEGSEGIYACDGERAVKISDALDPLFKGEVITMEGGKPVYPVTIDATVRKKNCMAHRNGRLYFSYSENGQSAPNRTLVFDIKKKIWASDDRGWTALADEGSTGDLLGASIGVLFALEYPDPANTIALDYRSAVHHMGTADRQKTFMDVIIEHSTKHGALDESLTVTAYYDFGTASESLGTISTATLAGSGTVRARTTLRIPTDERTARNIQIGIAGSVGHEVSIYGIDVHYYLHPRDAATFDSGTTNLGIEQVKQLDMIEIDIANAGATVDYTLYTDIPGGTLASRKTGTIATGARRVVEIPITTATTQVDGRLVRLKLICSGGTFRRYGTRFRVRPVGVYRDGANSEIWSTQETGVGI